MKLFCSVISKLRLSALERTRPDLTKEGAVPSKGMA